MLLQNERINGNGHKEILSLKQPLLLQGQGTSTSLLAAREQTIHTCLNLSLKVLF